MSTHADSFDASSLDRELPPPLSRLSWAEPSFRHADSIGLELDAHRSLRSTHRRPGHGLHVREYHAGRAGLPHVKKRTYDINYKINTPTSVNFKCKLQMIKVVEHFPSFPVTSVFHI